MKSLNIKDTRTTLLFASLVLAILAATLPPFSAERQKYTLLFVIDITRSMNVQDVSETGRTVSRLEKAKNVVIDTLRKLPCGSEAGLAVFTERRIAVLIEPIDICSSFYELHQTLRHLDWRMAWAADSRIGKGLSDALKKTTETNTSLIFLTDGHEAPPVNPRYAEDLSEYADKANGLIVGVGGAQPVPIPKFDSEGQPDGYYQPNDVPHRSTFGIPSQDMSKAEGFHARNAPFGNQRVPATEHLSYLHRDYLKQLAKNGGLHFSSLNTAEKLETDIEQNSKTTPVSVAVSYNQIPASLSLVFLLLYYMATNRKNSLGIIKITT